MPNQPSILHDKNAFRSLLRRAGLWEHYVHAREAMKLELGITGQKARRVLQPYYLPRALREPYEPPELPGYAEMLAHHQDGKLSDTRTKPKTAPKQRKYRKTDPWAGKEELPFFEQLRWARDMAGRAAAGMRINPTDAPDSGSWYWFTQAQKRPEMFMRTFRDQLKELQSKRRRGSSSQGDSAKRIEDIEKRLAEFQEATAAGDFDNNGVDDAA